MNSIVRAIERAPDVPSDEFRGAMRQLAGAVSIITAGRDREISGMTVTSLTSLSAEPPRLMVAINKQASSYPLIARHGFFGVSILAANQQSVAERFSNGALKGAERFAGANWITLASGAPVLADALVVADCEVDDIIERYSHGIVIGRPVGLRVQPGSAGLAYRQSRYIPVGDDEAPGRAEAATAISPQALWQV